MKAGLNLGPVNSLSQGHIEGITTIHTRLVPNLNFPIRYMCMFWHVHEKVELKNQHRHPRTSRPIQKSPELAIEPVCKILLIIVIGNSLEAYEVCGADGIQVGGV